MKNKLSMRVSKIVFYITTALLAEAVFSHSTYAEYSLGLTTSSSQTIDVSSNGSGTAISKTEINVTTTCQSGYNLSLSTTVSDNRLYLNGDSGNLSTGNYFSPSDGITDLVSADNTWGYYLPDADDTTPTVDSVFSAVPTLGSAATLRTSAQTASDTGINDTFSIYYGIKVTNAIIPGSYTMVKDSNEIPGTLVYYATLPEDCLRYTIEYNPTGTNMGTSVTGIGSIDNQYIPEGATVALTSEVYESPTIDDVTYYFTGWNTAQDGTGTQYASGQPVTDLATAGDIVTLYAQWTDCTSGGICYHKNSVSAEGTMGKQALLSTDTTATLLASNFSSEGNGFAGWNTARDYSGNFYGPNETISFEAGQYTDGDEGLSLYAVWIEPSGSLQDWQGCNEMAIGDTIALADSRDNQAYAVAKLADGKCWTIENLRLDDSPDAATMASGSQGVGGDFATLPSSSDSWSNTNVNTPQFNSSNTTGANNVFSYGNYYSWASAIANTTYYSINNQEVDTSICPSGWRLPIGGQTTFTPDGDYYILMKSLTNAEPYDNTSSGYGYYEGNYSNTVRQYPNNFVYSGYWDINSISSPGVSGYYWSSTTKDSNNSYYFYLSDTTIRPGNGYNAKNRGNSIRCVTDSGN